MGSGTLALACYQTERKYIGFEISQEYCKIAEQRLSQKSLHSLTVKIEGGECDSSQQ